MDSDKNKKKSGGGWWLLLLGVIVYHYYAKAMLPGTWAYTPAEQRVGERLEMRLDKGGAGEARLGGNVLLRAMSPSAPLSWAQWGPVLRLEVGGRRTTGLCLPAGGTLYYLDSSGLTAFRRGE